MNCAQLLSCLTLRSILMDYNVFVYNVGACLTFEQMCTIHYIWCIQYAHIHSFWKSVDYQDYVLSKQEQFFLIKSHPACFVISFFNSIPIRLWNDVNCQAGSLWPPLILAILRYQQVSYSPKRLESFFDVQLSIGTKTSTL